ncbi:hypothetical protein QVD17_34437 [Tagetes erecta]|uniref:Peroxisomal ATPase PEX1 n=1 Tax=Tagetes erecta TaxID=13708 RepID=A0AAD8JXV5_TARER|nr:hypothetical protein QVD17_34437 [Tagetes erecta]
MGVAGKSTLFEKLLRRRVEEMYSSSTPPANQLMIDGLCEKYPEYRRHKRLLKRMLIKQTIKNNGKRKNEEDRWSFNDDDITSRKKTKKININVACRGNMSLEPSEQSSEGGEEDISVVSSSEDEASDLTKSMLRDRYSEKRKHKHVNSKVNAYDAAVGPRFKDLGGMDALLNELTMDVIFPLYQPDVLATLGVNPMAGILLHGPPGCGKTKLAHAIANEARVSFYKVSASELISGISGASEDNIRELFSKAHRTAPSIVFIDEIDAIGSKRENLQRGMETRIVTQLMTCMDEASKVRDDKPGYVLVIAATNRPDALDTALRRPGRFDREISLGAPDEDARASILSVLTQNLKLEGAFDLVKISRLTPGFVGADLAALVSKAANLALCRVAVGRKLELCKDTEHWWKTDNEHWWMKAFTPEDKADIRITMLDFEEATKLVQPSLKRQGFSVIPNVKWEDVGGLESLRREFYKHIVRPIKYSNSYQKYQVKSETGFLLYGPAGCGKTLIAKAVASEARANFIHIQGPELLNKYVGEAELALRTIFNRARTCSPCILFFDEVDALTTTRGKDGGWVVERLVNQFLIELDGGDQRKGVYVIGATNRPEVMDRALLRPGRFGKLMYVPLPDQDERVLILKALSRNNHLDADVDLNAIARSCENFSGADLSKLMNDASNAAFEEIISEIEEAEVEEAGAFVSSSKDMLIIKAIHIEQSLRKIFPSVSDEEKEHYHLMSKCFIHRTPPLRPPEHRSSLTSFETDNSRRSGAFSVDVCLRFFITLVSSYNEKCW